MMLLRSLFLGLGLLSLLGSALAVTLAKTLPAKEQSIRMVTVDPTTGQIAVLKWAHDNVEVVVYRADGTLRSRFRPQQTADWLCWLPGERLLAPMIFPSRGEAPWVLGADGQEVARFGGHSPLLQMFVYKDRFTGMDTTPGGVLNVPGQGILMSATWADEDFIPANELAAGADKRFDKGLGAKMLLFNANGEFVRAIGAGWGDAPGQMKQPTLFAVDERGTLLAVQHKNGLDIFKLADGAYVTRIAGATLLAQSACPFLIARKDGKIVRMDFTGAVRFTYPALEEPLEGGCALPDGTLFLPGGPGNTFFRKYRPDGTLALAGGEPFTSTNATLEDDHATAGATVALTARSITADDYYRGHTSNQPFYAFLRPLLSSGDWQALPVAQAEEKLRITLPAQVNGPCTLRLTPRRDPELGEPMDFTLRIPAADSGSISLFTPRNRVNFTQGETIPVHIVLRAQREVAGALQLTLTRGGAASLSYRTTPVHLPASGANTLTVMLPEDVTRMLPPGDYRLSASLPPLAEYPLDFHLVAARPFSVAPRYWVWDSGFFDWEWNYPLTRGELAAWAGMTLCIKDSQYGNPLQATSRRGLADYLRDDAGLPAPELAFQPDEWQQFMDRGVANGMGLSVLVQHGWEGYPILRDRKLLAGDGHFLQATAQSLGAYPNFHGVDYNGTNFFMYPFEKEYKASRGPALPSREQIAALQTAWKPDTAMALTRHFDFLTGIIAKDYVSWGQAIREARPGAQRMATLSEGTLNAWPPALARYLDITESYKQSEQILPPYEIAVDGSWNSAPGLPQASTFEGFNETGTGERLSSDVALALLSGSFPGVVSPTLGGQADGDRSPDTKRGAPYVHREFFHRYALIADLLALDRVTASVGILLTKNQAISEYCVGTGADQLRNEWDGNSSMWMRFYSAYLLCQMAHHPARALFGEYLTQGKAMSGLKVILLAGQTAPLTPEEAAALAAFQRGGGVVLEDSACTVDVPGAKPLGIEAFCLNGFGYGGIHPVYFTDGTYDIIPAMLHARLPAFATALAPYLSDEAAPDDPDIFTSLFDGGKAQYLALVNTKRPPLPGLQFAKVSARFASVMPLLTQVRVPAGTGMVYDLLAGTPLPITNHTVTVDLRAHAHTVLALWPAAGLSVRVAAPAAVKSGDPLPVAISAVAGTGQPVLAAVPFLYEARSDSGDLLARGAAATERDGKCTLPLTAPLGVKTVNITVQDYTGSKAAAITVTITAGDVPVLQAPAVLAVRTEDIAPALQAIPGVTLVADGDAALNALLAEVFTQAGLAVTTQAPNVLAASEEEEQQLVLVTGGQLLQNCLNQLPFQLSENVPGAGHGLLAYVFSPLRYQQDYLVAVAPDDAGRSAVKEALVKALAGQAAPLTELHPLPEAHPAPAAPQRGNADNYLQGFRHALGNEDAGLALPALLAEYRQAKTARIGTLALSADGKTLFAGAANWDTNLYALSTDTGTLRWSAHAGQQYVRALWPLPGGGVLAHILTTDDAGHQAALYDADGKALRRFAAPGVTMIPNGQYMSFYQEPMGWSFVLSPDGKTLIGAGNFAVVAWDVLTGGELWHLDLWQGIHALNGVPSARLAISPDGARVAVLRVIDGIYDKTRYTPTLEVRAARSGALAWTAPLEPFDKVMANTPVWAPDGRAVLVGHANGAWEIEEGPRVTRSFGLWPGSYRPGSRELFDGKMLYGATGDASWRLDIAGHAVSWAWNSDGTRLAFASDLGEVGVVDAHGAVQWRAHAHGAAAVLFDTAGHLYLGDWSGAVRQLEAASGKELWQTALGAARLAAPPLPSTAYSQPPATPLCAYWPAVPTPPAPRGENIALASRGARVSICGQGGWGFSGRPDIDPALLNNGQNDDVPRSWQQADELWTSLTFDVSPQATITFPQARDITGVIAHESAAHPEAFPRFVCIDANIDGAWQHVWSGPLAPALTHTHTFAHPVHATAIRYIPLACVLNGIYTSEIEVIGQGGG